MERIKTKKLDKIISKAAWKFLNVLWLVFDENKHDDRVVIAVRVVQISLTIPFLITDLFIIFILFFVVKLLYLAIAYLLAGLYEVGVFLIKKVLVWLVPMLLIALAIFIYQEGKWSDITGVFSQVWSFFFNNEIQ